MVFGFEYHQDWGLGWKAIFLYFFHALIYDSNRIFSVIEAGLGLNVEESIVLYELRRRLCAKKGVLYSKIVIKLWIWTKFFDLNEKVGRNMKNYSKSYKALILIIVFQRKTMELIFFK